MDEDMKRNGDPSDSERNFILLQGFAEPASQNCHLQYSALVFQPRLVGLILLLGILFQSPAVFLGLAAVLWWGALLPKWDLFDAVYSRTASTRPGAMQLGPAPAPRRFARGVVGSFARVVGVTLLLDLRILAYVFEAIFVVAVDLLAFGRFCLGSFLYHILGGRGEFAGRTLPWSRR